MYKQEEERLLAMCHILDLPLEHRFWKKLEEYWDWEYLFDIGLKRDDVEYENKKKVKEIVNEFVLDVVRDDPEFVKTSRVNYLEDQINNLEVEYLKYEEDKIVGKIKWMRRELENWMNPMAYDPNEISERDIEMARSVDCADYIQVERRDYERSWARCPYHEEKTASFCCYKGERGFHCFGCGVSGDAITLVRKMFNKSFPDAIRFILNK